VRKQYFVDVKCKIYIKSTEILLNPGLLTSDNRRDLMYIAFLSDIHANLEALTAVRWDIDTLEYRGHPPVNEVCIVGDTVSYGSDPEACIDLVFQMDGRKVHGNHDQRFLKIISDVQTKPLNKNALWDMQRQMADGGTQGLMITARRIFGNYDKLTNLERPSARTNRDDKNKTLEFLARMFAPDFEQRIIEEATRLYTGELDKKPTINSILSDTGLTNAAAYIEEQKRLREIGLQRIKKLQGLEPKIVLTANRLGKLLTIGVQHTNATYPFEQGDPNDPFNELYVLGRKDPGHAKYVADGRAVDAFDVLAQTEEDISVYAHSHMYHVIRQNGKIGINVGTVGLQRVQENPDDPIMAEYVILNTDTLEVERRRIPYDIALTRRKMKERGLPDKFENMWKSYEDPKRLD
jgi:predicted phosphodiesterase